MSKELNKHHISIADIITILRIVGALILFSVKTLSISFLVVYFIAGLTDVIDGYIARKTRTTSDLGAKLDSIADVIFYLVLIILLFPNLFPHRLPEITSKLHIPYRQHIPIERHRKIYGKLPLPT